MPKSQEPQELNLESLAEQFDEAAQVFIAIAGSFRAAAGAGEAASNDAPAGKRAAAGGGKGLAAKGGAKSKAKAAAEDEVDLDTLRQKLKDLAEAKGTDAMVEALESVGATKLAEVDEDNYQELYDKAQEMIDAEEEPEDPPAKKTAAKKAAPAKKTAKKKAGPTLEDVQEAADALEAADPKAFKKVARKVGDHDDLDEDAYQDAIDQYEAAMPE